MKQKIAVPLDGTPSVVLLNNGERMTRDKAMKAGYRIADASSLAKADAATGEANDFDVWRTRVSCLPEARQRPAALAELLTTQTHATMTVDAARAFLRGLPVETTKEEGHSVTDNTNDPRAARLAEIQGSMNAFNHNRGYRTGRTPARPQPAAMSNVDPLRLKRMAEIRLNALHMNGHGNTQEAKSLKLALDTHNTVGTPLNRALAQLGVDASKFTS